MKKLITNFNKFKKVNEYYYFDVDTVKMYRFDLNDDSAYAHGQASEILDDNGGEPDGNVNLLLYDEVESPLDNEIVTAQVVDYVEPYDQTPFEGEEWMGVQNLNKAFIVIK